MLTYLRLFHAKRLENCIYHTFIFTYFCVVVKSLLHTLMISRITNINNLHAVVKFQVFLSNNNNYMVQVIVSIIMIICIHLYGFNNNP